MLIRYFAGILRQGLTADIMPNIMPARAGSSIPKRRFNDSSLILTLDKTSLTSFLMLCVKPLVQAIARSFRIDNRWYFLLPFAFLMRGNNLILVRPKNQASLSRNLCSAALSMLITKLSGTQRIRTVSINIKASPAMTQNHNRLLFLFPLGPFFDDTLY